MNYGYPESSRDSKTGSEVSLEKNYILEWDITEGKKTYEHEEHVPSVTQVVTIASSPPAPVYTTFTDGQVRLIILMAAFAGSVSPLSGTIYFPVINVLARDLQVSSSEINLTLTSYMILQGLTPMLFGDLADSIGRRPVFIIGFVIYVAACTGLALQSSYPALLVLRCLQSAGTSSTIAISVSVAADISTHAERGRYLGQVISGTALGTAVGPALGGILSHLLGWRSIFWFLAVMVGTYVVLLVLLFPETARNVVGNGSIQPQKWNKTLIPYNESAKSMKNTPAQRISQLESSTSRAPNDCPRHRSRFPNPLNSIKLIAQKHVGPLLFYSALVYTSMNTIIASTPYLFGRIYGYNDLQIGLSYIPFGIASFLAPLINGILLDWNFRRVARRAGIIIEKKRAQNITEFPLEHARFPVALPMVIIGAISLIFYGWALELEAHLAILLVLQFFIGLNLTGCFQVMNVVIVDYHPGNPATATGANNLMRCWMGGAAGYLIIVMIERMGCGWSFTLVALILLTLAPILFVLMKWGPKWRSARLTGETRQPSDGACEVKI